MHEAAGSATVAVALKLPQIELAALSRLMVDVQLTKNTTDSSPQPWVFRRGRRVNIASRSSTGVAGLKAYTERGSLGTSVRHH